MKINNASFEEIFETDRISFATLKDGQVNCHLIKFKVHLTSLDPIHSVMLGDKTQSSPGILLQHWFGLMLGQKLVLAENSEVEKYFKQTLFVNDISLPYITKTLFQILKQLLPETIHLLSLEYHEG